jgi:hypothetical protein
MQSDLPTGSIHGDHGLFMDVDHGLLMEVPSGNSNSKTGNDLDDVPVVASFRPDSSAS